MNFIQKRIMPGMASADSGMQISVILRITQVGHIDVQVMMELLFMADFLLWRK